MNIFLLVWLFCQLMFVGFFLIEPNKLFAFTRFNVHILVLKPLPKPNHVGPNSVEIVWILLFISKARWFSKFWFNFRFSTWFYYFNLTKMSTNVFVRDLASKVSWVFCFWLSWLYFFNFSGHWKDSSWLFSRFRHYYWNQAQYQETYCLHWVQNSRRSLGGCWKERQIYRLWQSFGGTRSCSH